MPRRTLPWNLAPPTVHHSHGATMAHRCQHSPVNRPVQIAHTTTVRTILLAVLVPVLQSGIVACGGDSLRPPVVTEIQLSPSEISFTALGESLLVEALARDRDGTVIETGPGDFTWTASDTDVVSVDGQGRVTAVGEGAAVVSAELNGLIGRTDVTVVQSVASVEMTQSSVVVDVAGSPVPVEAVATDGNGHMVSTEPADFIWTAIIRPLQNPLNHGILRVVEGSDSQLPGADDDRPEKYESRKAHSALQRRCRLPRTS